MSEPATPTDAVIQAMEARAAARRARVPDPRTVGDLARRYRLAAAVLHVFDPISLRPAGAAGERGSAAVLLNDSVPAVGWRHAGLRTLRLEVRRSVLRDVGSRADVRTALAANPQRTRTGLQQLFERWLGGERLDIARMSYIELEDLRQLYDWGISELGDLPPREAVELARSRRSAVAFFDHLVDRDFVGRSAELRRIDAYLRGRVREGPLAIWGPGGAGKTALVGRFLIEHVETPTRGWFPFAYLPFDSETLDIREPFTLLLAAVTQLATQAGSTDDPRSGSAVLRGNLQRFGETVARYRDRRGSLQRRASEHQSRGTKISDLSLAEQDLYDAFADVLDAASRLTGNARATPVLLVFDTFEEVVYRATEDLLGFWLMLDHLHSRLPQLRIIIAGRIDPADLPHTRTYLPDDPLLLGDLDHPDAVLLLNRLGVDDPAVAQAIARQIGGNPMSLRLAASVAREEHPGLDGLQGLSVHAIGDELVRGQLYRRLLDHIHDDDVRALAHPGMVLRRVTIGVIENVLAPACDLDDVRGDRARSLFDGLRQEQALVSLDEDGSLRYRAEVRPPGADAAGQGSAGPGAAHPHPRGRPLRAAGHAGRSSRGALPPDDARPACPRPERPVDARRRALPGRCRRRAATRTTPVARRPHEHRAAAGALPTRRHR